MSHERSSPSNEVSIVIRQHASQRPDGGVSYEADSYYLISPLTTWDGDLRVGERHVYRGAIRPGMLRLAAPTGLEYKCYPDSARALMIRLPASWLRKVLTRSKTNPRPHVLARQPILHVNPAVRRLTRMLSEKQSLVEKPNCLVTEGLAEALLGLLIEGHRTQEEAPYNRVLSDEQMKGCCVLADGHLQRPPSMRAFADHFDMSAKDFSRRFYRKNGITPYAWLMERRIRHAQELLRSSELPAGEVAFQLGFADQSHFTEAFRRRVGVSPVRWRAQQHPTR